MTGQQCYRFGELTFRIDADYYNETELLSAFRCEPVSDPDVQMRVRSSPSLQCPSGIPAVSGPDFAEYRENGRKTVLRFRFEPRGPVLRADYPDTGRIQVTVAENCGMQFGTKLILQLLDLPGRLLKKNACILHASLVIHDGGAIVFTGRKQIGKSTQAALWQRHRNAETVNGDRALLLKRDGIWYAEGIPFCGTSGICKNLRAPVKALVLLAQAPECSAVPAASGQVVSAFLGGCAYDSASNEQIGSVLDAASQIASSVSCVCLSCTPSLDAVECLERSLR